MSGISNRFNLLDGVRGIAALFVLIRHTPEFWNFEFYRSYLAVDLFFLLSGFVIASAYEEKLNKGNITLKDFLIIRLIRLYPVYILSLITTVIAYILTNDHISPGKIDAHDTITFALLATLFLPSKLAGSPSLFPLNGPYWSLFYELIVNAIYAIFRPFLKNKILIFLVSFFALLVFSAALLRGNIDVGHTWGFRSILAGFSRAAFGIFLGILIFRNIDILHSKTKLFSPWLGFIIPPLILSSSAIQYYNAWIDIISISILFPFSIIISSKLKYAKSSHLMVMLGAASYPIYVLHEPLSRVFFYVLDTLQFSANFLAGLLFIVIITMVSIKLDKHFDTPVRKYLLSKLTTTSRN